MKQLWIDGQAMRILRWLRANPGSSSLELTAALNIPNTTARISELRQAGYIVDCLRDGKGVRRYVVVEKRPVDRGETVGMFG